MKLDWLDELKAQEIELETNLSPIKKIQVETTKNLPVAISTATGKFSKIPWVEITGEAIDPEKGIRLSLDWNDEFVAYLKQNGITGASEEEIVQRYITMLYRELILQINQSPSEFE